METPRKSTARNQLPSGVAVKTENEQSVKFLQPDRADAIAQCAGSIDDSARGEILSQGCGEEMFGPRKTDYAGFGAMRKPDRRALARLRERRSTTEVEKPTDPERTAQERDALSLQSPGCTHYRATALHKKEAASSRDLELISIAETFLHVQVADGLIARVLRHSGSFSIRFKFYAVFRENGEFMASTRRASAPTWRYGDHGGIDLASFIVPCNVTFFSFSRPCGGERGKKIATKKETRPKRY